jgi:hypothetical protein
MVGAGPRHSGQDDSEGSVSDVIDFLRARLTEAGDERSLVILDRSITRAARYDRDLSQVACDIRASTRELHEGMSARFAGHPDYDPAWGLDPTGETWGSQEWDAYDTDGGGRL